MIIGPYRIHFTGFIESENGEYLVGNWIAWPDKDWPQLRRDQETRYFVACVPGDQTEYRPGANFPIAKTFTWEQFESGGGFQQTLERIWEGQRRLLKLMFDSGAI